jgi:hypothetical protein
MPPRGQRLLLHATGVLLFLFIPVVLVLFVRHPEPIAASLGAGVVLMLGHRFLARPFMERVRPVRCVWCGRFLGEEFARLSIANKDETEVELRACPAHAEPTDRFFAWLQRIKPILRAGIFVPLLALLVALGFAVAGNREPLERVTKLFQLVVGVTVNIAAAGTLWRSPQQPLRSVVPLHNFYLLGIRNILWIFRLVGIWWIWVGARFFLAR